MDIRVDGYRSSDENWLYAHRLPPQELPALTPEEREVAVNLGLRAEDYARSRLAGDKTRAKLGERAERVGLIIDSWMKKHGLPGEVTAVWLKTFQGKFRIEIATEARTMHLFIEEQIMDDLLDAGSRQAQDLLDRLLEANLGLNITAQAS